MINASRYLNDSGMEKVGAFGTDVEMRAAAELFDVAVFCFAPYAGIANINILWYKVLL